MPPYYGVVYSCDINNDKSLCASCIFGPFSFAVNSRSSWVSQDNKRGSEIMNLCVERGWLQRCALTGHRPPTLPQRQCPLALSTWHAFFHLILTFSDEETETHTLNHSPRVRSAREEQDCTQLFSSSWCLAALWSQRFWFPPKEISSQALQATHYLWTPGHPGVFVACFCFSFSQLKNSISQGV